MNPALLSARSLALHIGDTAVCRDLNLDIREGECWGILGPNGAGKTTLLHTLAGLRDADSGDILYGRQALPTLDSRQQALWRGLLFQNEASHFPGSVFETVLAGRHPHLGRLGWETPADLALARQAMEAVGLEGMEQRQVQTLSGGERQRMEIAMLLAQAPRLALLDEPSNHLDPDQQIRMLRLLKTHFTTPGHAMIMVLHDINLAMRFCDHLLLLRGDGQQRQGTTAEAATEENIRWLYGHPVSLLQIGETACFHFL